MRLVDGESIWMRIENEWCVSTSPPRYGFLARADYAIQKINDVYTIVKNRHNGDIRPLTEEELNYFTFVILGAKDIENVNRQY